MVPMNGQGGGYGQDVESQMQPGGYGQQTGRDPNAILNECRDVDRGIDSIERNLDMLRTLQRQSLNDPNTSPQSQINRELTRLRDDTMTLYRSFATRIKNIKSRPESGNPKNAPQVGRVDRRLKAVIQEYQTVEMEFRRQMQAQMERNYRIVKPDASEEEVRAAVEDTSSNQIFSQAVSVLIVWTDRLKLVGADPMRIDAAK